MENRRINIWSLIGGTAIIAATAVGAYYLIKKVWGEDEEILIDEEDLPPIEDKIIWIKQPETKAVEDEAEIQADLDLNGDGEADAVALDTTGDGQADTILADTTGDGQVDTALVDLDGDGSFDVAIALEEEPAQ